MIESFPHQLTKIQLLRKLIDEWKGENELELRNLQNNSISSSGTNYNSFIQQTLLKTIILDCDHFIKLINLVDMRFLADDDY